MKLGQSGRWSELVFVGHLFAVQSYIYLAIISNLTFGKVNNLVLSLAFVLSSLISLFIVPAFMLFAKRIANAKLILLIVGLILNFLIIHIIQNPLIVFSLGVFCNLIAVAQIMEQLKIASDRRLAYLLEGVFFSFGLIIAPFALRLVGPDYLLVSQFLVFLIVLKKYNLFSLSVLTAGLITIFFALIFLTHQNGKFKVCSPKIASQVDRVFKDRYLPNLNVSKDYLCRKGYYGIESITWLKEENPKFNTNVLLFNNLPFSNSHDSILAEFFPFRLEAKSKVFIAGVGSGVDSKALKQQGVRDVSYSEVNSLVCDLAKENVITSEKVYCQEAASFLKETSDKFDYLMFTFLDNNYYALNSGISLSLKPFSKESMLLNLNRLNKGGSIIILEQDKSYSRRKLMRTLSFLRLSQRSLDIIFLKRTGFKVFDEYWLFVGEEIDLQKLSLCTGAYQCEVYTNREDLIAGGSRDILDLDLYLKSSGEQNLSNDQLLWDLPHYAQLLKNYVGHFFIFLLILIIPMGRGRAIKFSLHLHSIFYGVLLGYVQNGIYIHAMTFWKYPDFAYPVVFGLLPFCAYLLIALMIKLDIKNRIYFYFSVTLCVLLACTPGVSGLILTYPIIAQLFTRVYFRANNPNLFLFNIFGCALGYLISLLCYEIYGLNMLSATGNIVFITSLAVFIFHISLYWGKGYFARASSL